MNCWPTLKIRARSASVICARVTAVGPGRPAAAAGASAAFEEIAEPDVELLGFIQIVAGEVLRTEERHELRIRP